MSRIRRNFASLMLSQIATQLATLATMAIVPKHLGAPTYGELAFATTFIGFFTILGSLGSPQLLVKQISRQPEHLGIYVVNTFALKLLLGTILGASAVGIAMMLGLPSETVLLIGASSIGMLLTILSEVLAAALQAVHRMSRLALWSAIQQYVAGGAGILLLIQHQSVIWYALTIQLGPIISIAANGLQVWPLLSERRSLQFTVWRSVVAGGTPFVLWGAIQLVYGSIDIIMLNQMTDAGTVGAYSLAYRWVGLPIFLPNVLITAVFPALSTRALTGRTEFRDMVNKAVSLILLVAVPMSVGIAALADSILSLFRYPSGFHQAAFLMRILVLHIPLVSMDMVLGLALIAKDKQRQWLAVGLGAAVFNPLVNLFAIPFTARHYGDGAIGAAVVTVATEAFIMLGAIALRTPGVLDRPTVSLVARIVAASTAMVPPVLALPGLSLPGRIALGILVYAAAGYVLRIFDIPVCRSLAADAVRVVKARLSRHPHVPTTAE